MFRTCGDIGFVLAPVALGYMADSTGTPSTMATLALGVAGAAGVFGVYGVRDARAVAALGAGTRSAASPSDAYRKRR